MGQVVNRRGFLKLLGMAAPAAVVAPKYFFAPLGGWTSDVIVPPDVDLCGIGYWQLCRHSGTWIGLDRTAYPGKLCTPVIGDSRLTVALVREFLERRRGVY
jgi:hypothetical protein